MRVQVNLSDDMVKRVDSYADEMGVTRSAFCAMYIGQAVMNLDHSADAIRDIATKLREEVANK